MSNASRLMGRKEKKPKAPRKPRKISADDKRYTSLQPAIVDGQFKATKDDTVYALRFRSGQGMTWHKCRVFKVEGTWIELWDETIEQWLSYDFSKETLDIRLNV